MALELETRRNVDYAPSPEEVDTSAATASGHAKPVRSWQQLVGFLLGYKLVFFLLIFAAIALWPALYSDANAGANFLRPKAATNIGKYFETWDAQWYLYLSDFGYEEGAPTTAFFPLWSLCVRAGSYLTGGSFLVSALILSNAFSVVALAALHRYLSRLKGIRLADRTLLLLLAFPGAIFFCFPYTESLFLLLSVWTFAFLAHDRRLGAGCAAFLAAATRPTGVLWVVPIAAHAWKQRKPAMLALIVFPVAGLLSYLAMVYAATGDPFFGFSSQQSFVAMPSAAKVLDVPGVVTTVLRPAVPRMEWFGFLNSLADRIWFFWFLLALWPIYKEDRAWFWFAVVMGLVPAMSTSIMSYTRYVLMVFPMFFITARLFDKKPIRFGYPALLVILFGIQLYALVRHINFEWVG
jgi:Gpi18-like mannosyltransferase